MVIHAGIMDTMQAPIANKELRINADEQIIFSLLFINDDNGFV